MNKFKDKCILRGGSGFYYNSDDFHAHSRPMYCPDLRYIDSGFRCVSPEKGDAAKRFVRIG